jgi:hypothetical protein
MTDQSHKGEDPRTRRIMEDEFPNPDGPQGYGIQDPEHPGEPNYWGHPVSNPVPGTAKQTRDEQEGNRGGQHDVAEGSGHRGGHGSR